MWGVAAGGGKQKKPTGDPFISSKLIADDAVKTEREYRLKHGFAFSYKLPVKMP